jgi:predicted Zn-dependent peptidase
VVYIVEDHQLPLVNLTVTARLGSFLDPAAKPGLAEMTGTMLRRGGTATLSAEEFDERVEFLAAEIDSGTGATSGTASLNCISPVLEESLELFFEMLEEPRFQEDRLVLEKEQIVEAMKQRNDQPQSISRRNWGWLIRGMESYLARRLTEQEVADLNREDLVGFHAQYWRPQNLIIGVSGDVVEADILASLERHFAGWDDQGAEVPWPPPAPSNVPAPGVYRVQKDIPQGRVLIGHLGYQRTDWHDPDVQALVLMNEILGGGGFTSRLVKRIRSDEGLAYSAYSQFGIDSWWPGVFSMGYQSKSSTVALAAKIALEELDRIRTEKVSAEELTTWFADNWLLIVVIGALLILAYAYSGPLVDRLIRRTLRATDGDFSGEGVEDADHNAVDHQPQQGLEPSYTGAAEPVGISAGEQEFHVPQSKACHKPQAH